MKIRIKDVKIQAETYYLDSRKQWRNFGFGAESFFHIICQDW